VRTKRSRAEIMRSFEIACIGKALAPRGRLVAEALSAIPALSRMLAAVA